MKAATTPRQSRRQAEHFGRLAELAAVGRLLCTGYRVLARRLKTPVGEIDILARRGRTLCIVEVKARRTNATALWALGARQRRRIERDAAATLARRPDLHDLDVRFDLVVVARYGWPRYLKDAWRPAHGN